MSENSENYQFCYKHPDRKTYLRCNKCGKPICQECAVQTPTGYRCKDCIKEQQKVFDTAETKDYLISAVIAGVLGFIGAMISRMIPFLPVYLSGLVLGTLFGKLICMAVRKAVNKRRSNKLTLLVMIVSAACALIAMSQEIIVNLNIMTWGGSELVFNGLLQLLMDLVYIAALWVTIRIDMNGMIFGR